MARLRQSQYGVEVVYAPANTRARVSQYGVEVVVAWTAASPTTVTGAGISQHGVEVVYTLTGNVARVAQYGVEVVYSEPADVAAGGGSSATVHSAGFAV